MGIEQAGKVATGVVEGLRGQPLALALVVINVLFLIAGGWFINYIGTSAREATQRRDALISQLAKDCIVVVPLKPPAAPAH